MTVEVGPDDEEKDNLNWLLDNLPQYLNDDPEDGNGRLLVAVAEQVDELDDALEAVDDATNVQTARTRDQIEKLAALVDVQPEANEGKERYRARVVKEFQLNTSEGIFEDIFGALTEILDCDPEDIWYQDWNKLYDLPRHVFCLPYDTVKDHPLDDGDIPEIVSDLTAAGKTVKGMYDGSHRPVSPDEYESTAWDGYDNGFDHIEDGSPTGEGGTVGGFLDN